MLLLLIDADVGRAGHLHLSWRRLIGQHLRGRLDAADDGNHHGRRGTHVPSVAVRVGFSRFEIILLLMPILILILIVLLLHLVSSLVIVGVCRRFAIIQLVAAIYRVAFAVRLRRRIAVIVILLLLLAGLCLLLLLRLLLLRLLNIASRLASQMWWHIF